MTEPIAPVETSVSNPAPAPASAASAPAPSQQSHPSAATALEQVLVPRIAIEFCTQCRWMLRAAYFAQELLSTFSTDLGEVALVPRTGGIFRVTIRHASQTETETATTQESVLWDRKRDGGFPEVKALKSLVRNVIDPDRDLGHTDRALKKKQEESQQKTEIKPQQEKEKCEDCS
ncbi:hypothetical protein NUU61_009436 [Penicillium alfredii]|uniref:Selenoprotein W-like protein n=1 Tax=Penicillium alfredii TaxID=1506179 RepID=A0A9W9JXP4_9EURO|nr:uncharacterized protein NUU61_009436 [Penicillium alfredii]KAJ5084857.1 hypothetical protein NUU61_009436 [Penicillium alfredii]